MNDPGPVKINLSTFRAENAIKLIPANFRASSAFRLVTSTPTAAPAPKADSDSATERAEMIAAPAADAMRTKRDDCVAAVCAHGIAA